MLHHCCHTALWPNPSPYPSRTMFRPRNYSLTGLEPRPDPTLTFMKSSVLMTPIPFHLAALSLPKLAGQGICILPQLASQPPHEDLTQTTPLSPPGASTEQDIMTSIMVFPPSAELAHPHILFPAILRVHDGWKVNEGPTYRVPIRVNWGAI